MDTRGAEACRAYIEAAHPTHPSLVDEAHIVDELFGIVNVPSGVWIDEGGMIVRPPEPAWTRTHDFGNVQIPEDASPELVERINLVRGLRIEGEAYVGALRDWVELGAGSRFALPPEEVIRRSHARPPEVAKAAAHFEIGQYLHRAGHSEDAVRHFREAHRLHPSNWTYKRQAWSLADPGQGPTDLYEGYWAKDVKEAGPENYYPSFEA